MAIKPFQKHKQIVFLRQADQRFRHHLRYQPIIDHLMNKGWSIDVLELPRGPLQRSHSIWTRCRNKIIVLPAHLYSKSTLLLLKSVASALILDLDDPIWLRPDDSKRSWFGSTASETRRRRLRQHIAVGVLFVCANPTLHAELSRMSGANLWRDPIPNPCPDDLATKAIRRRRNKPTSNLANHATKLLWIGTHATLPYVEPVIEWVESQGAEPTQAFQLTVLSNLGDAFIQREHRNCSFIHWSPSQEAEQLAQADIGLMPQPDTPWSRGKSGYKCLRYCSVGLPVVAAEAGNSRFLLPPDYSFIANDNQHFFSSIRVLKTKLTTNSEIGRGLANHVLERFNSTSIAQQWISVFESL